LCSRSVWPSFACGCLATFGHAAAEVAGADAVASVAAVCEVAVEWGWVEEAVIAAREAVDIGAAGTVAVLAAHLRCPDRPDFLHH
jgi:hypothetical protein